MSNLASSSNGATVPLATSNDERYPPEALIDGNPNTFWLSTGSFPQEIIISFPSLIAMETILLRCSKVARLRVERSEDVSLGNFQAVTEKDTDPGDDNELQSLRFELPKMTSRHLKFVILKSLDHFISFHSLIVTGSVIK